MQIVPPVMIMRTLASGSAIWRGDVLNSPILSRFGLPVGSKRSNELGAARRSRAVGNGSILAAQRPCKGKVGRKLMKVQTRLITIGPTLSTLNFQPTISTTAHHQERCDSGTARK